MTLSLQNASLAEAMPRGSVAIFDILAESVRENVGYLLMTGNHLDHLFIHPEHQHHGLGHRLLGAALARGIRPLTLDVFEGNAPARAFYERYRFGVAGRWFNTEEKATELRYVLA